jgi:Phosphatidylinositol transfer protein
MMTQSLLIFMLINLIHSMDDNQKSFLKQRDSHNKGQYTEKRIHLSSRLPYWLQAVTPRLFYVIEKSWNFFPFTITEYAVRKLNNNNNKYCYQLMHFVLTYFSARSCRNFELKSTQSLRTTAEHLKMLSTFPKKNTLKSQSIILILHSMKSNQSTSRRMKTQKPLNR